MQRRTVIRIAIALAALAGSTEPALAAGATGGATRPFSASGISFRYPANWRTSPKAWRWASSFSSLVTYLSTGKLHDPCARTATSISCSSPLEVLVPGGVLVSWTRSGSPSWTLAKEHGRPTTIGGHPARIQVARPGACRPLGASETVTATIATDTSNALQMQACLRGSTAAANERRVRAMLATLRLS